MNILFRCDGSVKIGMGHVVRCLAWADHLKENHDCKIHFAMRKSELGINRVKKSYPVIEANEQSFDYVDWFFDCISQTQSKILIMDMRDGLTKEQLKLIKNKTSIKVVTIDDPEDKRLEADIAFYPPVPQLKKINWDGFEGELYVDWEYVILRKEFNKSYPKEDNSISNILVSMGNTDEKNMTEFVINSLNQIDYKFKLIIIVGSGYPYLEQLKNSLEEVQFEFELYQNPKNIAEVMSYADFAVISFGQTAYELAALKVPALYLCLTDDHLESSKLFMNSGVGVPIGIFTKEKKGKIIKTVKFYITEKNAVKETSSHAKLLNISNLSKISKLVIKDKIYV